MPIVYEIRVEGHLDPSWSEWLEGMEILPLGVRETQLSGPLDDQAALHGVLIRIRDMNLKLLYVQKKEEK